MSLSFDSAELLESNCTVIKLNLTQSVEVWFQFIEAPEPGLWSVEPVTWFSPHAVFPDEVNQTGVCTVCDMSLLVFFFLHGGVFSGILFCLTLSVFSSVSLWQCQSLAVSISGSVSHWKCLLLSLAVFVSVTISVCLY